MKERPHIVDMHSIGTAHLIGVSGTGMRSLAHLLVDRGWSVSGSDCDLSPRLGDRIEGVRYYNVHATKNVEAGTTLVVFSSAISHTNPELIRGAELKIPTLSYAQVLGGLMIDRCGLAVAGTHGKSTVSAMAAAVLTAAGCDPTYVYGAEPLGREAGGHSGRGCAVLVEACEFRDNFLQLRPQEAIILNIDWDHVDWFPSFGAVEASFSRFASLLPPQGRLIVPATDAAALRAAQSACCLVETFCIEADGVGINGIESSANWQAVSLTEHRGCFAFDLRHNDNVLGRVQLRVPGRHNVANALAAAALAAGQQASATDLCAALSKFQGIRRRLETVATFAGVTWIDDYAHHPAEITASLRAIRAMHPDRKILCVFQPHQAARTAQFLDELAESLKNVDELLIAEIFRAREAAPRIGEPTAADLAGKAGASRCNSLASHRPEEIERFLATQLTEGDVLVTMGAGDIGRIGYGLMERFGCGR